MEDIIKKIGNVDFEITFDCNLRCLHCYNENHIIKNELSLNKIFNVIDQVSDLGFKEIHINGGEPLKHPNIIEILNYCNSKGLETLLETNATLLSSEIISELTSMAHLKIRASIDGPEKIHNSIRRTNDAINPYTGAINNLSLANSKNIPVQITTSINKINYAHIKELAQDLYKNGLNDLRLRLTMPSSSGYDHWQILKLNKDKLEHLKKDIDYISANYQILFDSASLFRTSPKIEQKCFITPQGNVKPYPFIDSYAGNLNDLSLKGIIEKYNSVKFPEKIETLMTNYLIELGMVNEK